MRKKLIIFNIASISIVILVITIIGNYIYRESMMNARFKYTSELQNQLSNALNFKIKSAIDTLELLEQTEAVTEYLRFADSESDAGLGVRQEQAVRDLFYTYEKIYPDYINMVLIHHNGKDYVSNDVYRIVNDNFYNEKWFKDTMQVKEDVLFHFYDPVRNLKSWKKYDKQRILSISKAMSIDGKRYGVLMIDLSLEDMNQIYRSLEPDANSFFFLMNDEGQVVLSPRNNIIYRIKNIWFHNQDKGIINADIMGGHYKLMFNKFGNENLVVVGVYDILQENKDLLPLLQISFLTAVLGFIVATMWSVFLTSRLTKPLVKLSELMKSASEGNLEVRFHEECDDEISFLGLAFNKMVVKINDLLALVYKEQQQKREAELQIMQEQIKPHFLYNTLDLIGWTARRHNAPDIIRIVDELSNFFRISLSKGRELIPLSDELKMITSYINIQCMRYGDLFTYEINCPAELESYQVLRMCLQPLVENCIYHGIKEAESFGSLLKIDVKRLKGGIEITVKDNGKPMDEATVSRLNRNLSTNNWSDWTGGFGIQNVGKRLWHTFSKGSGLRYSTDEQGFTVVTLTILHESEDKQNGE